MHRGLKIRLQGAGYRGQRKETPETSKRRANQVTGNRLQGAEKASPEGERTASKARATKGAVREWTVGLDSGQEARGIARRNSL